MKNGRLLSNVRYQKGKYNIMKYLKFRNFTQAEIITNFANNFSRHYIQVGGGACSFCDSQCTWNKYFCLIRENKFSQKTIFGGFTKINVHKSVGALLRLHCQNSKIAFKFFFRSSHLFVTIYSDCIHLNHYYSIKIYN